MRNFLALAIMSFALLGCEAQQSGTPSPESSDTTEAPTQGSGSPVFYTVTAGENIKDDIEECFRRGFGAMEDSIAEGWEIRVIARSSVDQDIYCDSLITISTLLLQRSSPQTEEEGASEASQTYRVVDHQVITIPSEKLDSTCRKIASALADRITSADTL